MIYLLLITLIVLSDQISKFFILKYIPFGFSKAIVDNIVYITHVRNTGGAFSIFQGFKMIFLLIPIVVIVLLVWAIFFSKISKYDKIAFSLILGGALGNLIDRAFRGYVIDFIDLKFWPVFNIADIFISTGIVLYAVIIIVERRDGLFQKRKI